MAEKQLEIVIDTPLQLWLQHHWLLVAIITALIVGAVALLV